MATKGQNVKLGLFVIVSLVVMVGLAVTFTTFNPLDRTAAYYVESDDAGGLDIGSSVQIMGVQVGTVSSIELRPEGRESVVLTLDIDREVVIQSDAMAYFELEGVAGQKVVDIRGGSPGAARLDPGEYIERGETLLDRLPDRAERLMVRTTELLETTDRMVRQIDSVAREVDLARVNRILESTDDLVGRLGRTSEAVEGMVNESRPPLRRSFDSLEETMARLRVVAESADGAVQNLDRAATEIRSVVRNNDDELRATLRNMRQTSQHLNTLSAELKRQPRLLIFGGGPPERELP